MRAVQIRRFGGPDVFEVVEMPTPVPGPGQVLVRVAASGINLAETLMRQNRYAITPELPVVLGTEVAGTIERVGSGVDSFTAGAHVAAWLFARGGHSGGYADRVVVDAELVVALPDALAFAEATALLTQGLTALFLTKQSPPAGKTVLVNAAAGGVGTLLVQLAKRAGARSVIAAASTPAKRDLACSLGADTAVDYTRPDWVAQVRRATGGAGPDIIYESVGGAVTNACLELLAPFGELVIYGALNIQQFELGVPELLGLIFKNQSLTGFAVLPLLDPAALRSAQRELFDMAARGELRVLVGATYPLDRVGDAHAAIERRTTVGKVVLTP
jgi:NADPH2:quinone reductase